ncbi:hypothetical protein TSO352_04365 [Azospirillum sp. TSO35-2]|nr:hypothetical protein TSO352_04365 [Azospirillum sp. TSO35-2]
MALGRVGQPCGNLLAQRVARVAPGRGLQRLAAQVEDAVGAVAQLEEGVQPVRCLLAQAGADLCGGADQTGGGFQIGLLVLGDGEGGLGAAGAGQRLGRQAQVAAHLVHGDQRAHGIAQRVHIAFGAGIQGLALAAQGGAGPVGQRRQIGEERVVALGQTGQHRLARVAHRQAVADRGVFLLQRGDQALRLAADLADLRVGGPAGAQLLYQLVQRLAAAHDVAVDLLAVALAFDGGQRGRGGGDAAAFARQALGQLHLRQAGADDPRQRRFHRREGDQPDHAGGHRHAGHPGEGQQQLAPHTHAVAALLGRLTRRSGVVALVDRHGTQFLPAVC